MAARGDLTRCVSNGLRLLVMDYTSGEERPCEEAAREGLWDAGSRRMLKGFIIGLIIPIIDYTH